VRRALENLWDSSRRRRGIAGNLLYFLLLPLSWLYGVGLRLSQARRKAKPPFAHKMPVLIVGNLTTGGTGKTPMAETLARRLSAGGWKPAILSRGYGGKRKNDPAVVGDGKALLLGAAEAGDEPVMLARQLAGLGITVVVGVDRVAAAELAVESGARALVLDDGFQQRMRFPGSWKAVMVNTAEPFDRDTLLPAGNMREPKAALVEADAVILTHADEVSAERLGEARGIVRKLAPGSALAEAGYVLQGFERLDGSGPMAADDVFGKRALALSAIGYPEGFERMLKKALGGEVMARREPDHHEWTAEEVSAAISAGEKAGCAIFVTTPKDGRKMEPLPESSRKHLLYEARAGLAILSGEEDLEASLRHYLDGFGG